MSIDFYARAVDPAGPDRSLAGLRVYTVPVPGRGDTAVELADACLEIINRAVQRLWIQCLRIDLCNRAPPFYRPSEMVISGTLALLAVGVF